MLFGMMWFIRPDGGLPIDGTTVVIGAMIVIVVLLPEIMSIYFHFRQ